MKKILLFIFIVMLLFSYANINTSITFAQDVAPKKEKIKDARSESEKKDESNYDKGFKRELHPCETNANRKASSTGLTGVLQYDIDCVPFHQNEILDLTGKSSYSIVGWIPRIITDVYRFMFTLAVIAFLIASFKYYKAAVTGKGGVGISIRKIQFSLDFSLDDRTLLCRSIF